MSIAGLDRFDVATIAIEGIPSGAAAVFRSRVDRAARELIQDQNLSELEITVTSDSL